MEAFEISAVEEVSASRTSTNYSAPGKEHPPRPTTEHFDDELDSSHSFVCEVNPKSGRWECHPYKCQILAQEIAKVQNEPVIAKLKDFGVRVFVIPHNSCEDMFDDMERVIRAVSNDERNKPESENQCCLLYRDCRGRLFNLMISGNSTGLAGAWKNVLMSFSGFEAMVALVIMVRSLPCASGDETKNLRPAYLSLILGLVFSEEISFSWVNVSMLVRGVPSISAYTLTSYLVSDWLRKLVVLILALAGAATGTLQKVLTLVGICLACLVLAANLGSRAWFHLKWNPLRYDGFLAPIFAFLYAAVVGLAVPYMGHREVEAGGKAAMETVLQSSLFVAIIFVVSDFNEVQKFLIVGSESCNQDIVNVVVGAWWMLTLFICIHLVRRIPRFDIRPDDEEPLLEVDEASPVGYKVPCLPDFPIDPTLASRGHKYCSLKMEIVLGVIMALGVGSAIILMGFTDLDDEITQMEFDIFR